MNERLKEIGWRIRLLRKEKGMTQEKLSEILQISPSHMSDIENGKKNIGLDIFMRLTEALQVSADWLLQTDVPSVRAMQYEEWEKLLSGCSQKEQRALLRALTELKKIIHSV